MVNDAVANARKQAEASLGTLDAALEKRMERRMSDEICPQDQVMHKVLDFCRRRFGSHSVLAAKQLVAEIGPTIREQALREAAAAIRAMKSDNASIGIVVDAFAQTVENLIPNLPAAPDDGWEYEVTTGPRKAWFNEFDPPDNRPGWEIDHDQGRDGWERFDFHEERYWKRRKEIWSDEKVEMLNRRQSEGRYHPYTCPGDKPDCKDRRSLIATRHGWVCRCGAYTQTGTYGL